ncbi:septal ring lytic transglycosylase RlpA family protein [Rufibacter sp. LB8]|uniref:septal ring lytic transglycosylase RlpA family protein n=1 Tax=Rufibacter sp. LB8 TaxID=2777781 RepID=UPI00178C75E4|nr:septal ring lytic transglycosylase RlpA family protein [Rufibacter sp. LB8]
MGIQKIYYAVAVLFISFFSFLPAASAQEVGDEQNGVASWYGSKYHGRRTSSGEVYNRHKLTAAHNGLPLGTKVKVTNLTNGESVVVKINDRGPFRGARIIDLSEAAAKKIKYRSAGLADVKVEVLELPEAFLAARAKTRKPVTDVPEEAVLAAATPAAPVAEPAVKAESPVPAAPTAPAALQEQLYVIQAGSFGSKENAESQIEKLRRIYQKMPIARREETVNGKTVHRIMAGRFNSKAEADKARKELQSKGFQGLVKEMAEPTVIASAN